MKKRIIILIAALLVFSLMMLVSCGDGPAPTPTPDEPCEHVWDAGKLPAGTKCGTNVGTFVDRTYTCTLCGETKTEEVEIQARHDWNMDPASAEVVTPVTCMKDGLLAYHCRNCAETYKTTVTSAGKHSFTGEIKGSQYVETCSACGEVETYHYPLTYSDFGAKGDGRTNDLVAIIKTHNFANEHGFPVKAESGKTYYLATNEGDLGRTAYITTDTDWTGATFIIDDKNEFTHLEASARGSDIFIIAPDKASMNLPVPQGLSLTKGQTKINGLRLTETAMLLIVNANQKDFIREGVNADNGFDRQEVIIVDKDGNVDPSTPIQYDYTAVTGITMYSMNEKPITVQGGEFITIANDPSEWDPNYVGEYLYYRRGIGCCRSNTIIKNVTHTVTEEVFQNGHGAPYVGFYNIYSCAYVTVKDCKAFGHHAYSFYVGASRNEMGSYDVNVDRTVGVKFDGLEQQNNINDRNNQHGLMGTNYCRNIELINCWVDRFDAHKGVYNVTIKDSTLGFGLLAIGSGTIYCENVDRLSGDFFILLREDYGSLFDGDIILKDCTLKNCTNSSAPCVIQGRWMSFNYGLPAWVGRNITLDNFRMEDTSGRTFTGGSMFKINGLTGNSLTDAKNPFHPTLEITYINMNPLAISALGGNQAAFASTKITKK